MSTKKIIGIAFCIVAICTSIYAYPYYLEYKAYTLNDVAYEDGLRFLKERIHTSNPELEHKKYYYLSAWNTRCKPCIKEMPLQDAIADSLSSHIGCIHVSDDTDENINHFLTKKGITSKHFVFMNSMNTFISAVYKKKNIHYKVFPTHIVIDSIGNILYFKQGSISHISYAAGHIPSQQDIELQQKLKDPLIQLLQSLK